MERLLLACAAGLALSCLLERWRRPPLAALAVHAGLFCIALLLLAAACQRPLVAAGLALAFQLLLRVVGDAKQRALREPLLFSDYALFSQALRHPRLYLPYLQLRPALFALGAFLAVGGTGLALEPPGIDWHAWALLLVAAAILLAAGCRAASRGITLEPVPDTARLGLPASGLLYWLAERGPLPPPLVPAIAACTLPTEPPDIVVVECESFFDARRLGANVPGDVLREFDALCAQASCGRLTVPAWGANTMRTEFAFLSGIAPERLGVHRFNPYRRYAHRPLPTLASRLRESGYRTLCVHPYPASFFGRDRVFPKLGFDAFIDLEGFRGAPRDGPYVADAAVAHKLGELLRAGDQPCFAFAITMENHGPQHLEAGPGGDELAVYLRHLRNSDAMIGELARQLRARGRDAVLCVFGDHVPSLPAAYAAARFEDARTDYLVWRTRGGAARRSDLRVEELAALVLSAASRI